MLFNSLEFLLFAGAFFPIYYGFRKHVEAQNLFTLAASYFFYGWWDYRFLGLLLLSTVVDFTVGRAMSRTADEGSRKLLLWMSLGTNLGVLGFFKYFNFFADSTVEAFRVFGLEADPVTLQIVLPVGISFYTFQTLSYTLDVYWRKLEPEESFLRFALFVSFFPQLVAGPIERATALLGQIATPRSPSASQIHHGIHLIAWGFFKKMVIADNLAKVANPYFDDPTSQGAAGALVGILAFTFQIFADFSGYTDIARGLSKCMGFELMLNFVHPYLSVSPSDFWTRWHISLSSWLRDYLYIPLGGNRAGPLGTYRNLCITMLLGGLWHGAAWNFVLWGAYHGLILVIYRLAGVSDKVLRSSWPRHIAAVAVMFVLTMIGWVLFRCDSLAQIANVGRSLTSLGSIPLGSLARVGGAAACVGFAWMLQVRGRDLGATVPKHPLLSGLLLATLTLAVLLFGPRDRAEFIYFQF